MKLKAFILTMLIVGLIAAVGFFTVAEEADSSPLTGNWTLNFFWNANANSSGCDEVGPSTTTSLSITMLTDKLGKFTTGDGGEGFVLNPSPSVVLLVFTVGCKPVYISKDFNGSNYMSGTMKCREGSGSGTWNATKK
ncbi:hypothetical protein FJZ31_01325 [Candidatus Poribacteria bacterium]|nr:hypothetical protein [Candidatus Poribacteria bacterium]